MQYPILTRASVVDCPVHKFTVALDDTGRISSKCPACEVEARLAVRRLKRRRRR